jgi:hypothetical protein
VNPRSWFTVPDRGSSGPPLTGSVVIPTVLIEITRQRLEQDRVDAIAASDGPLSPGDWKALEEGLLRAREEYEAARARLRAINARPAGQAPRGPAARAS